MHKTLILSLLFAIITVPVSAQTPPESQLENESMFHVIAIQSFGWKCDRIVKRRVHSMEVQKTLVYKLTCENNLTYFVRMYEESPGSILSSIYCHKGACKKLK